MKFKANVSDLNAALDVASLVHPSPIDSDGSAGYLLVVRGEKCYVYSSDDHQKVRTDFPVFDVEGEGAFVLPSKGISAYKNLDGWIEFEPATKDDACTFREETQGGSGGEYGTFDPRSLQVIDKDFEASEEGPSFSVMLLKEAITLAKPYLAELNDSNAKDYHKSLQIFDASKEEWAKGNGTFYSSDGKRAFYFQCSEFVDKGLALHGSRIGLLNSFLSKSEGQVQLRKSTNTTYLVNSKGQVVGWSDQVATHGKYMYFPFKNDKFILRLPKGPLVKALNYIKDKMGDQDKIRIIYDHERKQLQFQGARGSDKPMSSSWVVPVGPDNPNGGGELSETDNFALNVSVSHFLGLVTPVKVNEVELRICPANADTGLLRTVEEFSLDARGKVVIQPEEGEQVFSCRVTRFMSSMRG